MIKADSLPELETILEKHRAKAEKAINDGSLVIVTIEFGHYRATGSKGNVYDCFAGRDDEGQCWVACLCPGSLHNQHCYHCFAVFHLHKELAQKMIDNKRKAENKAMDNAPYLKQGSNKKREPAVGKIRI